MPFIPGKSGNPKGRPKGLVNTSTREFREALKRNHFDLAETFMDLLDRAYEGMEYGNRQEKPIYLKIAADLVRDIASYSLPKLKAVEHKRENQFDKLTRDERLDLMRRAVKQLEGESDDKP